MGCDIHTYIEQYNGGKWEDANLYAVNQYFKGVTDETSNEFDGEEFEIIHFWDNRDYYVFGALAQVRMSPRIISPKPKGLPNDLSPQVAKQAKNWELDAHSHSWLTLKELGELAAVHRVAEPDNAKGLTAMYDEFIKYIRLSRPYSYNYKPVDAYHEYVRMVFWFDN